MTSVKADHPPALHTFVTGSGQDLDAVVAGLSLPYGSGAVEDRDFGLVARCGRPSCRPLLGGSTALASPADECTYQGEEGFVDWWYSFRAAYDRNSDEGCRRR